eukprot:1211441-Prorocentrum_lima.AAC.1
MREATVSELTNSSIVGESSLASIWPNSVPVFGSTKAELYCYVPAVIRNTDHDIFTLSNQYLAKRT